MHLKKLHFVSESQQNRNRTVFNFEIFSFRSLPTIKHEHFNGYYNFYTRRPCAFKYGLSSWYMCVCKIYIHKHILDIFFFNPNVLNPPPPSPDEQQNRRARLMNGKSRTRYLPKWQTQPSPPTHPPLHVCLTLPADHPLTLPTSVQTHPAHCKMYTTLSLYPRTAYDLSTRSPGRRKSTAVRWWHRNFRRARCILRLFFYII